MEEQMKYGPWNLHVMGQEGPDEIRLLLSETEDSRSLRLLEQVRKEIQNVAFQFRESQVSHNSNALERSWLECIRTGDIERAKRHVTERIDGVLGIMSKDPLRSVKNAMLSEIVLFSRAAIEGGLHPETAYTICDGIVLVLEEQEEYEAMYSLMQQALLIYTAEVHAQHHNQRPNIYAEECKKIIYRNLHSKITVAEIAAQLGISPGYLEKCFVKAEGISVKSAILQEKIRAAKNMLRYSDVACSEIASYLGFCSQSHFGKEFRKETGMSPLTYRDRYKNDPVYL